MAKEFDILKKFESLDRDIRGIKRNIEELQKQSHAPKDFVVCETCKCKIKEKK